MRYVTLALAMALAPATSFAADLSGAWTVNGAFGEALKYSVTCTLTQDASGKLSGPCQGDMTPTTQASGTVSGSDVELAYDTSYQGSPVHLDYKGDVQSDGTLKGVVDAGGPQGSFTASKK